MAFGSGYSRVNPTVASSDYRPHNPSQAMEFSNSLDTATPRVPKQTPHSYTERANEHSPPSSTDLPNYEPYGNQYGNGDHPRPPRRGTGNSLVTTLSSVWTATRDHISHFRIRRLPLHGSMNQQKRMRSLHNNPPARHESLTTASRDRDFL